MSKPDGIYEYDPLNGTKTLKYSFNDCDVNRFECQDSVMLYCDENTAVVACVPEEYSTQGLPPPPAVYTLEKADKNPNAGKTVVTVAALSSFLTFTEAEGIKIFNEQNPEYFAKLTVYDQRSLIEGTVGGTDIDDEDKNTYSAVAMISGNLIADIRAGMGPDVVFGASQSIDLLNGTYLTDLSPYLKSKNFDQSAYYMNVINAAQIDGKMYFVPIGFTMTGIITDGDVRRAMQSRREDFFCVTVAEVMSTKPKCVSPDTKISVIQRLLHDNNIHAVLVTDDDRHLLGIVDSLSCML